MNFMLLDRLGIQDFDAPEIQDIISYGRKEIAECEEHAKNMESYADEFYERYMKEK